MSLPKREPQLGGDILRDERLRHIVVFLVIGVIAGWLASWIVGGDGLLTFLLSGIIGSFVGGYIFSALRIRLPISNRVESLNVSNAAAIALYAAASRA